MHGRRRRGAPQCSANEQDTIFRRAATNRTKRPVKTTEGTVLVEPFKSTTHWEKISRDEMHQLWCRVAHLCTLHQTEVEGASAPCRSFVVVHKDEQHRVDAFNLHHVAPQNVSGDRMHVMFRLWYNGTGFWFDHPARVVNFVHNRCVLRMSGASQSVYPYYFYLCGTEVGDDFCNFGSVFEQQDTAVEQTPQTHARLALKSPIRKTVSTQERAKPSPITIRLFSRQVRASTSSAEHSICPEHNASSASTDSADTSALEQDAEPEECAAPGPVSFEQDAVSSEECTVPGPVSFEQDVVPPAERAALGPVSFEQDAASSAACEDTEPVSTQSHNAAPPTCSTRYLSILGQTSNIMEKLEQQEQRTTAYQELLSQMNDSMQEFIVYTTQNIERNASQLAELNRQLEPSPKSAMSSGNVCTNDEIMSFFSDMPPF